MKSYHSYVEETKKKIDKRYRTGQGTKGDQNIRDRDDEEEGTRSKTRPTAEAKKVSADDAEHATALYRDQWKDRHIADYDKQHGRADRAKEMRADAELDRKREYLIPENAVHQLKGFMERIGLTFPEGVQLPTGNGSISIPLQRWGGTFGKTATTPFDEFENDPENVGLDLKITVEELRNNSWKVYAKIV